MGDVHVLRGSQEKACVQLQGTVDVHEYYKELGHPIEKATRDIADLFQIKLVGSFKPCECAALTKAMR